MNTTTLILSRRVRGFQRFFEMGQEESSSPFLSEEGKRFSRNLSLKIALLATLLLASAFFLRLFGYPLLVPFLLSLVFLLVGSSALSLALEDIFIKKDVNIDVLMTVAAFGALVMGSPMEGGLLLVLFELSSSIEEMVTYKAKRSLVQLSEINPEKALCVDEDGSLREKDVQEIKIGEIVVVRSGEVIPLDGSVVEGQASLSLVHLTGEERAVFFPLGASVPSGARVLEGVLHIQTEVTSSESTIAKLILLLTKARSSKPILAQKWDVWGKWYAGTILSFAGILLCLFPFLGREALYRALTFLVTASPCALILAIPISYVSALGSAMRQGAIVKGGIVFDRLQKCHVVAFDKTGTLTMGSFEVVSFERIKGHMDEKEAFALLASLEQYAVHPLAQAIVCHAEQKKIQLFSCFDVHVEPGLGLFGNVQMGRTIFAVKAGNRDYMKETEYVSQSTKNEILLSINGENIFVCTLKDSLRSESKAAVSALKLLKKQIFLISGDKKAIVCELAHELSIEEVRAEASPEQKLALVSSLAKGGLAMVGDGLNDAPSLAQATVGISMGSFSSASAREASDVILLRDNLALVPWLFQKASDTRAIIRQNMCLAIGAILMGTVPALFGEIPLWCAVLLHEGSTLIVGLNGLRLLGAVRQ